ncbi:MAG: fdrA domain protein [Thermoprotei archaeon]|nr:fdrA domain protein [Thermoprotei archaeon]
MSNARKLFDEELKVINVGLKIFYEDLKRQGVRAVQVNYQPPPKLEKELKDKLSELL